ncbi:hypothetical protein SNOD_34425 [Streptomyces nodosus]|uniref:Uncharacterized protein n=1 Tax=Streptomyces nodosus TaxID=40318 RepID=A0A0B5DW94_9ACTN|nr:hypothetical protein SNOD_34425 [Streptomyces nodosus]
MHQEVDVIAFVVDSSGSASKPLNALRYPVRLALHEVMEPRARCPLVGDTATPVEAATILATHPHAIAYGIAFPV